MTDTVIHSFKINQTQEQPHVVPVVLTVLVHFVLLGVLYFGMTLQTQQPTEVEIWDGAGLAAANSSTSALESTVTPPTNDFPNPNPMHKQQTKLQHPIKPLQSQ